MAREAKKRIGRPPRNPPTRGKRVSLGLKVTAEVKRHLDSAFRTSGRTQSQEAEHLIEKALAYDQMLDAISIPTSIAPFRKSGRTRLQDERYELTSIALRRSGRTRLQDEHYAERVPAIWEKALANELLERVRAIWEEIERGSVEAALRRRNWRHDGTTGHWIPPEVHRLAPDGCIEQSAPAAKRRDK
jgi:hypothetical protein